VDYEKYGSVKLTEDGEKVAEKTLKKHKVLLSFFTEILGVSPEEAEDVSCRIEHIVDDSITRKIKRHIDACKENGL